MTDKSRQKRKCSKQLHRIGLDIFPGGVSHNVRSEPPHPMYIERANGAHIWDADGNKYVDFWNNHNASLLGHSHPDVVKAVRRQAQNGLHYGAPNELMLELGRRVQRTIPSAERLRFCASGTEATMYCIRLARAATDRDHVLKVEGAWHGGNTVLTVGVNPPFDKPTTNGLPPRVSGSVHAFPLNDRSAFESLLRRYEDDIAAVILDPRNIGFFPDYEFVQFIDEQREARGYQLIFDEVITAFRLSGGSYQAQIGVTPDLTALGKALGGGLPIGAFAGRADLFEPARPDIDISPEERVIAGGGTFTANPMTLAAGLATLDVIEEEPVYEHTEALGQLFREGLTQVFYDVGVQGTVLGMSSLLQPVFAAEIPSSPTELKTQADADALRRYHNRLIDEGYYFLPGHIGNVSYQITEDDIKGVIESSREILIEMIQEGLVSS